MITVTLLLVPFATYARPVEGFTAIAVGPCAAPSLTVVTELFDPLMTVTLLLVAAGQSTCAGNQLGPAGGPPSARAGFSWPGRVGGLG